MGKKETDVHTEHCCLAHGCKYGNSQCSVTSHKKPQSRFCEDCYHAAEKMNVRGVMAASAYDMIITLAARVDVMTVEGCLAVALAVHNSAERETDPNTKAWLTATSEFFKKKGAE